MKILSLNVWFDNYLKEERTTLLIDYILTKDFDIIMLQEVTASVLSFIYKRISNVYPFIHTDVYEGNYGTCIISKYEIQDRQNFKFNNSRMNRGLVFGKINDIIFCTSHFESEFSYHFMTKVDQFNQTFTYLSKFNKVFFIGDTNITKRDEQYLNYKNFNDVYLEIDNSKDNIYTYDGIKNPFLKNKIRSRVDRCYLKDIIPKSYVLEKDIVMSDHYALLIEI